MSFKIESRNGPEIFEISPKRRVRLRWERFVEKVSFVCKCVQSGPEKLHKV